ncbi:MAG: helix-turn-helix domain-containing protein [Cyanobacteria bacterium TGS_CYA1]|nr:helix-turn-helix domain-containing protein [Cyanobacteria bacterium TGS_CYA1]
MRNIFGPIPKSLSLAPTLAGRLQQIREYRDISREDLSQAVRFTTQRIDDLESGLETWLSATDRQVLAKALGVEPKILQEVEHKPNLPQNAGRRKEVIEDMVTAIFNGANELECPDCGNIAQCSLRTGFDLNDKEIFFPKAFCLKCPFVLIWEG